MDIVDRLYQRVLMKARGAAADPFSRTWTVEDVYQRLVPYRAVRDDLDLLEFAAYEHALMRLLAGERGYVELQVPHARDELRKELDSPNPILGVYRDYAGIEARFRLPRELIERVRAQSGAGAPRPGPASPPAAAPARRHGDASGRDASPASGLRPPNGNADSPPAGDFLDAGRGAEEPMERLERMPPPASTVDAVENRTQPGRPAPKGIQPPPASFGPPAARQTPRGAAAAEGDGGGASASAGPAAARGGAAGRASLACRACGGDVPADPRAMYCPHCGVSRLARPCARCEAPLQPGWRFCARCGAAANQP